jgi:hypothetical protein
MVKEENDLVSPCLKVKGLLSVRRRPNNYDLIIYTITKAFT